MITGALSGLALYGVLAGIERSPWRRGWPRPRPPVATVVFGLVAFTSAGALIGLAFQ